jgi:hypothetical protein
MSLNLDNANPQNEETRAVIAESAQRLFRANWWSITRQQVADIAGVSYADVAMHFPTLRSLVHCAYANEITALASVVVDTISEMDATPDTAILNFIHTVAKAIGQRPVLAMSLLPPFMVDSWASEGVKAPRAQVTSDELIRALCRLLKAHWEKGHPEHPSWLAEVVAKQTVLGMLSAAANKRTERDIVKATKYQLL